MAKKRKQRFGRKWDVDLTGGKLVLVCLKRWSVLDGIGKTIQGDYVGGLNKMGEGSISGVVTDSISSAAGFRIKKLFAPKGVPIYRSRSGSVHL